MKTLTYILTAIAFVTVGYFSNYIGDIEPEIIECCTDKLKSVTQINDGSNDQIQYQVEIFEGVQIKNVQFNFWNPDLNFISVVNSSTGQFSYGVFYDEIRKYQKVQKIKVWKVDKLEERTVWQIWITTDGIKQVYRVIYDNEIVPNFI